MRICLINGLINIYACRVGEVVYQSSQLSYIPTPPFSAYYSTFSSRTSECDLSLHVVVSKFSATAAILFLLYSLLGTLLNFRQAFPYAASTVSEEYFLLMSAGVKEIIDPVRFSEVIRDRFDNLALVYLT